MSYNFYGLDNPLSANFEVGRVVVCALQGRNASEADWKASSDVVAMSYFCDKFNLPLRGEDLPQMFETYNGNVDLSPLCSCVRFGAYTSAELKGGLVNGHQFDISAIDESINEHNIKLLEMLKDADPANKVLVDTYNIAYMAYVYKTQHEGKLPSSKGLSKMVKKYAVILKAGASEDEGQNN